MIIDIGPNLLSVFGGIGFIIIIALFFRNA